jgi:hypothetical protein
MSRYSLIGQGFSKIEHILPDSFDAIPLKEPVAAHHRKLFHQGLGYDQPVKRVVKSSRWSSSSDKILRIPSLPG